MGLTPDLNRARAILREEAQHAAAVEPDGPWVAHVRKLSDACEKGNKTIIAMLGTALLAKATDIRLDVFSLKESDGEFAYSARRLCQEVLAAEAKILRIDLGVTGREPLNNQPFFGNSRISKDLRDRVHARGKEGFDILMELLELISIFRTEKEARAAFRAFLFVREKKRVKGGSLSGVGDNLAPGDLLRLLHDFVSRDSESGKRAQVVTAALLDVLYGPDKVKMGRINDPSRRFPGDIHIGRGSTPERVIEVKDKRVSPGDIRTLVERSKEKFIGIVAVVLAANDQERLDNEALVRTAEVLGVRLRLFYSWNELLTEALWYCTEVGICVGWAYRRLIARAEEGEINAEGLEILRSAV